MGLNEFTIEGMTCQSCVQKVTQALQQHLNVDALVSLEKNNIQIKSKKIFTLDQVEEAIQSLPKYKILSEAKKINSDQPSLFETYKPLICIFTYVFLVSLSYQVYTNQFHLHTFMNHIMAGFFLGLSFFKFLDLNSFADSFSRYDPIAKKIPVYGKIYPFIELILGLMFISGLGSDIANVVTAVVLLSTTSGVIRQLRLKNKIQCACAGSGFNLPLSSVTVFENTVMILMAFYVLIKL